MHRITIAVLAALLWNAVALAQDDTVIRIPVKETKKVGMSENQIIAEVRNENPKVCNVQSFVGDPRAVLVVGLAPGQSRLVITSANKQVENIDIFVYNDPVVGLAPGQVEINFLEGSTVRLALQIDRIDFETIYGKLSVTTKDLRAIEFGLRIPEDTARQIAQAVKALRETNFRERDQAVKTLVSL